MNSIYGLKLVDADSVAVEFAVAVDAKYFDFVALTAAFSFDRFRLSMAKSFVESFAVVSESVDGMIKQAMIASLIDQSAMCLLKSLSLKQNY